MTLVDATRPTPDARDLGRPGRPVRAGSRRPHLPHLGADLRLQPGLRPLPVELGPARPARAHHRRVQGGHRRVRADADLLRQHRRRRAHRARRTSGSWSSTPPPTTSGSSSPPTARGSPRRWPDGWPASDYVDVQISLDGATADVNDAVRGDGLLRHRPAPPWSGWPRPASRASSSRWWSPATTSPSSTTSRPWPTGTGPSSGSPGCGRRAAGPTSGTSSTPPPTSSGRSTTGCWPTARSVLTGDSFFHLAGYGEALPGTQPVRRRTGGLPGRPGGRRLRLPVRHPRRVPGRQRARPRRVRRGSGGTRSSSPSCAAPTSAGACRSCGHYDACRGGCMAAKFFTGLPLDGPDPECVLGHGEAALAARPAPRPARPSPDHSRRRRRDRRRVAPPPPPAPPAPGRRVTVAPAPADRTGPATSTRWPALPAPPAPRPDSWPLAHAPWSVRSPWPAGPLRRGCCSGPTRPTWAAVGRSRDRHVAYYAEPGGRRGRGRRHRDGLGPPLGLALRAGPAGRRVRSGLGGGGRRPAAPTARWCWPGSATPGARGRAPTPSRCCGPPPGWPTRSPARCPMAMEPDRDRRAGGRLRRRRPAGGASGLDGVEIDAGPYSLLRQFHSGLTNLRDDAYGDDRLRLTPGCWRPSGRPSAPTGWWRSGSAATSSPRGPGSPPTRPRSRWPPGGGLVDLVVVVRGGPFSDLGLPARRPRPAGLQPRPLPADAGGRRRAGPGGAAGQCRRPGRGRSRPSTTGWPTWSR